MKKTGILFFVLVIQIHAFAQKSNENDNLAYVKNFYERLKKSKMDVSETLVWKFTYMDTSLTTLTKLSKVFETEGLKVSYLDKSTDLKEKNKYELTVYEKKTYKAPKLLNERLSYLNSIAHIYRITDELAAISAVKPDKTTYLGDYQKVGRSKN